MGCNTSKQRVAQHPPSVKQEPLGVPRDFSSNHAIGREVETDYVVGDLLGKGSFGSVYVGTHRETQELVAVKIMDRGRIKSTSIEREWTVLEHLGKHENVVEFKGAYATSKEVCFVLEIMHGGELFDRLIRQGAYSETDAREPFRQVASALQYLHARGIIHRDLKPENLLLSDESEHSDVKIADFGLSQLIKPNQKLTKVCGTWAYAAPEMSDPKAGGYDCRFDTWGYGVILFVVLCGYHPFDPEGGLPVPEIKARARAAIFDFNQPEWDSVSDLAKDLLRKLIVKNPQHRLTAAQILKHPWFTANITSTLDPLLSSKISAFQVNYKRKLKASIYGSFFIASLRTMSLGSVKPDPALLLTDRESRADGESKKEPGSPTSYGSISGRGRGSSDGSAVSAGAGAGAGASAIPSLASLNNSSTKRLIVADRHRGSFSSSRAGTPLAKRLPTIKSTSRVDIDTGSSYDDSASRSPVPLSRRPDVPAIAELEDGMLATPPSSHSPQSDSKHSPTRSLADFPMSLSGSPKLPPSLIAESLGNPTVFPSQQQQRRPGSVTPGDATSTSAPSVLGGALTLSSGHVEPVIRSHSSGKPPPATAVPDGSQHGSDIDDGIDDLMDRIVRS